MKFSNTISIALCVFNGEKFLPDQLKSISEQTRLPDELVVVNDTSSDNSLQIIQAFEKTAQFPVIIHTNTAQLGPAKSFKKAFELCTGEYIAPSDQDDFWISNKLYLLENALIANPKIGYSFANSELVDENLKPFGYTMFDRLKLSSTQTNAFNNGQQMQILLKRNIITGMNALFKAKPLRDINYFIPEGWMHDAWYALYLSSIGYKGVLINTVTVRYRQHHKQVLGGKKQTLLENFSSVGNTYYFNRIIDNITNAQDFLSSQFCAVLLSELNKKKQHIIFREKLTNGNSILSVFSWLHNILNKKYFKYSDGIFSAVKDLAIFICNFLVAGAKMLSPKIQHIQNSISIKL